MNYFIYTSHHSTHRKIWTQLIDLAPNVWLHSSVGRASHRYRGGHGFESRWSPDFFQASSFHLLKLENLLQWSYFTFINYPCIVMHCAIMAMYMNWLWTMNWLWKAYQMRRNNCVMVIRRRGIFYGDKDPKLEVDESVYFLTTRKGSMILVNWKQRLQNTTKYKAK